MIGHIKTGIRSNSTEVPASNDKRSSHQPVNPTEYANCVHDRLLPSNLAC
jgi:hypothetical protein